MPSGDDAGGTRMNRAALAVVVAVLALAMLAPLLLGLAVVDHDLPGGLPLGNLMAAGFLAAWPAIAVVISRPRSVARTIAVAALLLALAWLPVSILMAGNLRLSFADDTGERWGWLTLATLAGGLLALLACAAAAIHARWRRPRQGNPR